MSELYIHIGKTIKECRLTKFTSRKVTQQELANELGVTFQQIQKYERATNKIPLDKLLTVAMFFNKSVLHFIPLHMLYYKNAEQELTPADTDPDVQKFMASKAFV